MFLFLFSFFLVVFSFYFLSWRKYSDCIFCKGSSTHVSCRQTENNLRKIQQSTFGNISLTRVCMKRCLLYTTLATSRQQESIWRGHRKLNVCRRDNHDGAVGVWLSVAWMPTYISPNIDLSTKRVPTYRQETRTNMCTTLLHNDLTQNHLLK